MIFNENKINKSSISYEMACNCARTENIYAESVLKENRFNLPFLYHLRRLEGDYILETLEKLFKPANNSGAFSVNVFEGRDAGVFKINSSHDIVAMLNGLDATVYDCSVYSECLGKTLYKYEVIFELTL